MLLQIDMPCFDDIPGRPALFRTEIEERQIEGKGRWGKEWEERTEGKLQSVCKPKNYIFLF